MKILNFIILLMYYSIGSGQSTLKMKYYNSALLGGVTYEVLVTENLLDTSIVHRFNQGFDLFFEGKTDEAINIWKKIVETSKDIQSNVYGMSFFYVADAYFGTKQADSAEVWFKKILASSLIDSTETGDIHEPYGNYKYLSCKRLSSIYGFYKPNYEKAIAYIDSADYNYPYYGFKGSMTSIMEEKAKRVWWKSKMFYVAKKDEDAYYTLLNELYKSDYPIFFEENNKFLLQIITTNNLREEFLKELNKSLEMLMIETKENKVKGTFKFRDKIYSATVEKNKKDIQYFDDNPMIKSVDVLEKNKDYFINRIKKSSFYKSLKDN